MLLWGFSTRPTTKLMHWADIRSPYSPQIWGRGVTNLYPPGSRVSRDMGGGSHELPLISTSDYFLCTR